MDTIQSLISYLAYIGFFGGTLVFILRFLQDRKKVTGLKQISGTQARLAMLRISIKAKIKKKSLQFRASFKKAIPKGEIVDQLLEEMTDLKFETGHDFQKYFDLSKKIKTYVNVDNAAAASSNGTPNEAPIPASGPTEDFMSSDFKNELAIIRLIKEIVEVSSDLNRKIDGYNSSNKSKPLPRLDALQFSSMIEVNKIFDQEPADNSKAS